MPSGRGAGEPRGRGAEAETERGAESPPFIALVAQAAARDTTSVLAFLLCAWGRDQRWFALSKDELSWWGSEKGGRAPFLVHEATWRLYREPRGHIPTWHPSLTWA